MPQENEHRELICYGTNWGECSGAVTHIDNKGYTYCAKHGIERRDYRPCRKLLKRELETLLRGEAIAAY